MGKAGIRLKTVSIKLAKQRYVIAPTIEIRCIESDNKKMRVRVGILGAIKSFMMVGYCRLINQVKIGNNNKAIKTLTRGPAAAIANSCFGLSFKILSLANPPMGSNAGSAVSAGLEVEGVV